MRFRPSYIYKDPDAVRRIRFDCTPYLGDDDDINTATVTADPGLTVDSSTHANGVVSAWLSGGTHRTDYTVRCRLATIGGVTDDGTVTVRVRTQ
jgi:hypothetical protein